MEIAPQKVVFNSEGEPVQALYYQPQNGAEMAIVVSPSRITRVEEMRWLAEPLLGWGYAVLVQGYRTGRSRYQVRDVADVRNAVSYLLQASIPPRRVGVIGHSRGASASLRAAASDPRIACTVSLSAPVDIAGYMNTLRDYAPGRYRVLAQGYGAVPEDDPHYYREISPLFHADRIRNPVLLIHGVEDMVAPKENSERMYQALKKNPGIHVDLELIPEVGHFFEHRFNGYHCDRILQVLKDWLHQRLPV